MTEKKVGDTVLVTWGRFGNVTAKIVKVMPDNGLQLVRWNKRRECWTEPKRYYKHAGGGGWHAYDASDPTLYGCYTGKTLARCVVVNAGAGDEIVNIYRIDGELVRTVTGAEAGSIIKRERVEWQAE